MDERLARRVRFAVDRVETVTPVIVRAVAGVQLKALRAEQDRCGREPLS